MHIWCCANIDRKAMNRPRRTMNFMMPLLLLVILSKTFALIPNFSIRKSSTKSRWHLRDYDLIAAGCRNGKVSRTLPRPKPLGTPESLLSVTALSMWSSDDQIEGADRIRACIPYLLPLIDGDHFGHFIYDRIPLLGFIDDFTVGPLSAWNHKIPFLGLGLFVLLTLGTRFNLSLSRNVRFSAQQAALIDVALLFPELIGGSFAEEPLPRAIAEPCTNFVWYAYMTTIVYCIYNNLKGKRPDQIPYISGAADLMTGPF